MSEQIKFTIDGKEYKTQAGKYIADAAAEQGVYIPTLCHLKGEIPAGSCRICTVKVNGRTMAACTTPVENNMVIENNIEELNEIRKIIVELLFVEGNHFCPSCEKSGNCELQAIAYRYQMMVPRFPYNFPVKNVDASTPKIYLDRNRCILCKKCIRTIKDPSGQNIFAFRNRGDKLEINIDKKLAEVLTDDLAMKAMDICPVGAILKKETGFIVPIGKRKYDKEPIGSDVEKLQTKLQEEKK